LPGVELVLTTLHSGGKYGQGGYKFSGGTHGVGAKCVNAVSEWFEVEVSRNGEVITWSSSAARRSRNSRDWQVQENRHAHHLQAGSGDFPRDGGVQGAIISQRLRELAFLNSGLEIIFTDERQTEAEAGRFFYKDGVEEFVKQLNKSKEPLHPKPIAFRKETKEKLDDKEIEVHVEVVLQYNDSYNDQVLCYTNTIHNPDGGTHLSGFRSAVTRAINQYAKSNELLKEKDPQITGDDVREGLTAVISVKHSDPKFESQTKGEIAVAGSGAHHRLGDLRRVDELFRRESAGGEAHY
jgi:DNA gyrase subunit B